MGTPCEQLERIDNIADHVYATTAALKHITESVDRIDKAVNGNGRPGLAQAHERLTNRVIVLEERADSQRRSLDSVNAGETKRSDRVWKITSGALLAIIIALVYAVKDVLLSALIP